MTNVAAIAKLTAQPGKRDELIDIMTELVDATEQEAGTQMYLLHADARDDDVIWFYELYADQAALDAHSRSDTMKAVGAKLAGVVAGRPELHLLNPVRGKGVALQP